MNWYVKPVEKIAARSWGSIAVDWIGQLPTSIRHPEASLSDRTDFIETLRQVNDRRVSKDSPAYQFCENLPSIRADLFTEAIFLFNKSCNVFANAEACIGKGLCCWSLSTAYHASYFAAKCILNLLGVYLSEKGFVAVVDIWHYQTLSGKDRKRYPEDALWVCLPARARNIEHTCIWEVLLRLTRITSFVEPVKSKIANFISSLSSDEIASHRNLLHYRMPGWPFLDELTRLSYSVEFDRSELKELISVGFVEEDFRFCRDFALTTISFCRLLLNDIAAEAPSVATALLTIDQNLSKSGFRLVANASMQVVETV